MFPRTHHYVSLYACLLSEKKGSRSVAEGWEQAHVTRARVRISGPTRAAVGVRLRGRDRERGRERESESRMYLCISGAGSGPDMAMVVLVGRCSISLKQRGVFYIWYICSS